ncbi:MAG: DUF2851 family protein [Bacteroidales bacterium]|jgi:hypothetical protein|nr:DUF2851 family protein [Bacteroidales bacterium]
MITEAFLHHVWRHRLYQFTRLQTISGQEIKVIHPGYPHQDAGPDFKEAIIQIDHITWAGNVEIHVRSSDWLKHGHQQDARYRTVVLHVVFEHDIDISMENKEAMPTLALKQYIADKTIEAYASLTRAKDTLPCRDQLHRVTSLQFAALLSGKVMERLSRKLKTILTQVENCKGDWEEAFFRTLAINFGFKTNASAFELLARSLPYKIVSRHANSRYQTYALIFGQAGMLEEDYTDSYYKSLQYEYQYLKQKYGLIPMGVDRWNYLRLHPRNFPCIRLAQFSEILHRYPSLFQMIVQNRDRHLPEKLLACTPHEYWETHYYFGKCTRARSAAIGKSTVQLLIINTVITILMAYSRFHGNENVEEYALQLLENLDFEENNITKKYREAGFPDKGALYSQAILELHSHYCQSKRCLSCDIAGIILKS